MALVSIKVISACFLSRMKIKDVIKLLEHFYTKDENNQEIIKMQNMHLRSLRIYQIFPYLIYISPFIMLTLLPFLKLLYGFITSHHYELEHIGKLYLPFDQNQPLIYVAMIFNEVVFVFFSVCVVLMTDLLYIELVALTALQFNILSQKMNEINPQNGQELAMGKLKELINIHRELIEITQKLEKIFSPILFIDVFGILGATCLTSFLSFVSVENLFFFLISICCFYF